VYFIFELIYSFTLAPVPGAVDTDYFVSICEPDSKDPTIDLTETVEAVLALAVLKILGNYAMRIRESVLSQMKRNTVLDLVGSILGFIPFKVTSCHGR
jgi:hypothetical protein